jgi:hypothetical protein
MKLRLGGGFALVFAGSIAAVSFMSVPGASQNAVPSATATCIGCSADGKTTPRMADGHPDFNGYWGGAGGDAVHIATVGPNGKLFDFGGNQLDKDGNTLSSTPGDDFDGQKDDPKLQPPYKPEYMAKVKQIADETFGVTNANDPMTACKPQGIPRASFGEMQVVQTPQAVAILRAEGNTDRIIYTDGRGHAPDFDSTYMGDSIGHWDGDTLVVDTVGLNDDTWLSGGYGGLKFASIHSDQEHVIERWSRDGDTLTYQATIEDPVMFTQPWVMPARRIRHSQGKPDDYLSQIPCLGGNSHLVTNGKFLCNWGPKCVTSK